MITIGEIAEEYGVLPSMVLAHATTYDIMILDVMRAWKKYQQDLSSGRAPDVDEKTLMEIMAKNRG